MGNSEEKIFECASEHFKGYMVRTDVKKVFPHIPCEPDIHETIAYASGFDDSEVAKLKEVLPDYSTEEFHRFFSNSIVQELRSIDCFEDRERRVVDILHSLWRSELKYGLEESGVQDVDRWWTGMENLNKHNLQNRKREFLDRMLEGMYALALQKGGFNVQMNPYGGQGPDLQIRDANLSFDIEVSRFGKNKGLERKLGEVELPEVIDSKASMLGKSKQKVKQLHEDKNSIVLLHSENTGIDYDVFVEWIDINSSCLLRNSPNLCAAIFDYQFACHKGFVNPYARMPEDNLRPVLSRIVKALNRVKGYTVAKLCVV